MKNISEILKSNGVEVSDEQLKAINSEVVENYRTITDYNKQKDKLELSEKKYKDTQKAFEDFKQGFEGVDIAELKGKVDTLTNTIETQKGDYEKKIAKMNLDSMLNEIAKEKGCKDYELAQKMIDYEALLSSKNQKEDIEKQFATLKENKPILFEVEKPNGKKGGVILPSGRNGEEVQTDLKSALKDYYK